MTDDLLRRADEYPDAARRGQPMAIALVSDLAAALRAERAERDALRALLRDLREALGHEMSIDETERIDAALEEKP